MIKKLISLNLALVMLLSLVTVQVFATEPENQLEEELPEKYIVINGETYDASQEHSGDGWAYYPENPGMGNSLHLRNYTGSSIECSDSIDIYINGSTTIHGEDGKAAISAGGKTYIYLRDSAEVAGGNGVPAIEIFGDLIVVNELDSESSVDFISGGDSTPALSVYGSLSVDKGALFTGTDKSELQYSSAYNQEPVLRIAHASARPSETITSYIEIGGVKYDATQEQCGDGWEFHPNDYLRLYDYNGGAIVCTGALHLYIDGTTTITGADENPAISVNGDTIIAIDAPAVLTGGKDSPAIKVSGNLNINRVYRYGDNGLSIGDDELYLISGGEDIPAISCEEEISIYESALFAGAAKENLQYVTAYADQPVLRLAGAGEIPEEYITEYIMIDGKKYDANYSRSGENWSFSSGDEWNSAKLYLNGYNGGPIICTESLRVHSGYKNIVSTVSGKGGSAIQVDGLLTIGGNLTVIGDGAPAFDADTVEFENGWPLRVALGDSAASTVSKDYTDYQNIDAVYNGETYVQLETLSYTLALHGNGGTTTDGKDVYSIIKSTGTPGYLALYPERNTFSYGGAYLLGWSDSPNASEENFYPVASEYPFPEGKLNADLYAVWEDETNKAVLLNNCDFCHCPSAHWWAYEETMVVRAAVGASVTLPESNRRGYRIIGWRGEDGELYPVGTEIMVTETISFTAEYEENQITYLGNGGVTEEGETVIAQEFHSGYGLTIRPASTFHQRGYTFIGWNTQQDGSGTWYPAGMNWVENVGNLNLYAQWEEETDNYICLDANRSDLLEGKSYQYVQVDSFPYALTLPNLEDTDQCVFVGWSPERNSQYNTENLGNHVDPWYAPGDEIEIENNTTLYAVYVDTRFCFDWANWGNNHGDFVLPAFYGNGGETSKGSTVTYTAASGGDMVLYGSDSFYQEGYELVSWNTKPDGSGQKYELKEVLSGTEHKNEIIKLYAQWESESIDAKLETLIPPADSDQTITVQQVQEALKGETDNLRDAMTADPSVPDGTTAETVGLIQELEKAVVDSVEQKIEASNSAPQEIQEIVSDIEMLGAVLNWADTSTEEDESATVTLKISEPETGIEIPEEHTSVQFSMKLNGAIDANDEEQDGQQLIIPIYIDMPVPANIDPNYLVILHKLENGEIETILPQIYWAEDESRYHAAFVIDQFSDFALLEYAFGFSTDTVNKTEGDQPFVMVASGNANGSTVTYSSSDSSVAKVDSATGKVTILKSGAVTIKATASSIGFYPEAQAQYTLMVEARSASHNPSKPSNTSKSNISVEKPQHGKLSLSSTSAVKGSEVTITVIPDNGYQLDSLTVLEKNGQEIILTNKGNGVFAFTMPGGKVAINAVFVPVQNRFTDIPAGAYYEDAVDWALKNNVTTGLTASAFGPDVTCTRAQAVTFLWRASGCPAPSSADMPFTDVASDAYYRNAVLWAVEKGITKGTSDTTFSPDATCVRGQIVTFLWRSQGAPDITGINPFVDVVADAYYVDAVLWAVEKGITTGTSLTAFSPDSNCTRAQIVTFLYRCLGDM